MSDRPDTGLRLHEGENWAVAADVKPSEVDENLLIISRTVSVRGVNVPAASLRRIGWLDQRGRVYTGADMVKFSEFDGGSLTPLLIDPREDGR